MILLLGILLFIVCLWVIHIAERNEREKWKHIKQYFDDNDLEIKTYTITKKEKES